MEQRFEEGLGWARWAVSRWASFPVNQEPRPLLVIGPDLMVEGGFSTGEAKVAFMEGRYELLASVPQSVRAALARRPKGPYRPRAGPNPGVAAYLLGYERADLTRSCGCSTGS
jgi:hypothetical protein